MYNTGDKIVVVGFKFKDKSTGALELNVNYFPRLDTECEILDCVFNVLTVKECIQVKHEYAKESDLADQSGYIAEDSNGNLWYNNYPLASIYPNQSWKPAILDDLCKKFDLEYVRKEGEDTCDVAREVLELTRDSLDKQGLTFYGEPVTRIFSNIEGGILQDGNDFPSNYKDLMSNFGHITKMLRGKLKEKLGVEVIGYDRPFGTVKLRSFKLGGLK